MEIIQKQPSTETNKTDVDELQKEEAKTDEFCVSELISNLKEIKKEEQDLLRKRNELQAEELKLRNQVAAEVDEKKDTIARLKAQITFLQKKCDDLEQVLGIDLPL
jgi:predicted transcriptional regulator